MMILFFFLFAQFFPTERVLAAPAISVPISVRNTFSFERTEVSTFGLPIPQKANLLTIDELGIRNVKGELVPAEFHVTSRWGGGPEDVGRPIRWILISAPFSVGPSETAIYRLTNDGNGNTLAQQQSRLFFKDNDSQWLISTGTAEFVLSKDKLDLFSQVTVGEQTILRPDTRNGFFITSTDKNFFSSQTDLSSLKWETEEKGPMRIVLKATAVFKSNFTDEQDAYSVGEKIAPASYFGFYDAADEANTALDELTLIVRYIFTNEQSDVGLLVSVQNLNPCVIGNGPNYYAQPTCQRIGSLNSIRFEDLRLQVVLADMPVGTSLTEQNLTTPTEVWNGTLGPNDTIKLSQESTGFIEGDDLGWNYQAVKQFFPQDPAYAVFPGNKVFLNDSVFYQSQRSKGWIRLSARDRTIGISIRDFWQNAPKSISMSGDGLVTAGLYPIEFSSPFRFRAGEQKTDELLLVFDQRDIFGAEQRVRAFQDPLRPLASAAWYADSGAFGRMVAFQGLDNVETGAYERQVALTVDRKLNEQGAPDWMDDGPLTLPDFLRAYNVYGWRLYGDQMIDFEQRTAQFQNKYDFANGFIKQFVRTIGTSYENAWWNLADPAVRHTADFLITHAPEALPVTHFSVKAPWGMVFHEAENQYDPLRGNSGNQGTSSQLYFGLEGLIHYYYLTGYQPALDTAKEAAENILWRLEHDRTLGNAPDKGMGYFEWFDGEEKTDLSDGRGVANFFSMVIPVYEATGESRWLEGMDLMRSDLVKVFDGGNQISGNFLDCPCSDRSAVTAPWRTLYLYSGVIKYLSFLKERGESGTQAYQDLAQNLIERLAFFQQEMIYPDTPQKGMTSLASSWSWTDGSRGDPDNSNWSLVAADVFAALSNLGLTDDYKNTAEALFRHGSSYWNGLNWAPIYSSVKEAVLSVNYGGEVFWMMNE
ncbi:MAG: hypothetical protein UU48_C0004G0035 [Candidatus Uhrbacteria bacterium GW2011_GWF2_41_16]|uniref:Uncharacterized protein n=1 Tax=Candidatus Uhrbacteria bacterium GW2011_GWF2_41_16 TaxID=1618997 RepID=A0A0G0YD39_9BACT|nr:MAG: hypothetical protein UU48_C0004G0035 [Candidatus Uhrbacteria bacterium GW2011_GWF2_41_16]